LKEIEMSQRRRTAGALALVLAAVVVGTLVPTAATAQQRSSTAADEPAGESVLWDPGPSARCYSVITEPDTIPGFTLKDTSGCAGIDNAARVDGNASCWPGGDGFVGQWGPTCPAWRFNTWGWDHRTDWQQTPGFDLGVGDSPSADSLALTLRNDARDLPAETVCQLREASISYDYPPSALKRMPNLNENLTFSYIATVTGGGRPEDYGCATEKRSILTSDIIWVAPNPHYDPNWKDGDPLQNKDAELTHVISVVQYNPNDWSTSAAKPKDGVLWWNGCEATGTVKVGKQQKEKTVTYASGCRVTIAAPTQLSAGERTPVVVDVTALAKQYAKKYLGQKKNTIDPAAKVRAVQVVSSNIGSNTTSVIDSIDLRAGGRP
jgi:hypothetical protein